MNGKQYPTMNHAGNYGGMLHFLKAIEAAQTRDGAKIVAKMKELPTEDVTFGRGRVREDGRHLHAMYLWEVKKGEEARREQCALRLRQAHQNHSGRRGVASSRPGRLPVCEAVIESGGRDGSRPRVAEASTYDAILTRRRGHAARGNLKRNSANSDLKFCGATLDSLAEAMVDALGKDANIKQAT